MKATDPDDVVKHFGGVVKTQTALGLKSRQTVYFWLRSGKVPELRARQVHEQTRGKLKFDRSAYEAT